MICEPYGHLFLCPSSVWLLLPCSPHKTLGSLWKHDHTCWNQRLEICKIRDGLLPGYIVVILCRSSLCVGVSNAGGFAPLEVWCLQASYLRGMWSEVISGRMNSMTPVYGLARNLQLDFSFLVNVLVFMTFFKNKSILVIKLPKSRMMKRFHLKVTHVKIAAVEIICSCEKGFPA